MPNQNPTPRLAVLPVHGMGPGNPNFADRFRDKLRADLPAADWKAIIFEPIYYQRVLQQNQKALWQSMSTRDLDWKALRKLLLFGFSDAASLERNASAAGSPYEQVQREIQDVLRRVFWGAGRTAIPVIVVAQSLGSHVMSNYIWDAQRPAGKAGQGVWRTGSPSPSATPSVGGRTGAGKEEAFLRLRTLRYFYTTGCNIPIFLAGFRRGQRVPVATKGAGYRFEWKNFYDEDDVLGWPLRPLSASYAKAVKVDREINVGRVLTHWNPLSHKHYWTDKALLNPLVQDISSILGGSGGGGRALPRASGGR